MAPVGVIAGFGDPAIVSVVPEVTKVSPRLSPPGHVIVAFEYNEL